ncbi:MAG: hypothetical protein MUP09_05180 [Thiovulaceae bacterium]|nr:hypothetical protein [Sulfurimonadaceae bacterium]
MKLVKMSLLAATLIASSAFAIDNVKVSGDAMLFYGTNDGIDTSFNPDSEAALFNKDNTWGQASLGLGVTADLTENVSSGAHLTAVSTMGLTNIVSGVFESGLTDEFWFDEAWIAGTAGKTTGKIGRMTLDTPLAFTETWSVAYNTFEAGLLTNEDIPDTTLAAAYIGAGNNGNTMGAWGTNQYAGITADSNGTQNTTFAPVNEGKGAYAFGAVNNSWAPLTAQGWYYVLPSAATAYWLQADYASEMGLSLGGQFTGIDDKTVTVGDKSNTAYAGKVAYEMKETFAVSLSGSQTGENDNNLGAGFNLFGAQTSMYTEAWWNYAYVTRPDTTAISVMATTPEELTYVALGVYATQATVGENGTGTDLKQDMSEVVLEVAKSFGPLDAGIYYIYTDAQDQNNGDSYGSAQAYFTYNF